MNAKFTRTCSWHGLEVDEGGPYKRRAKDGLIERAASSGRESTGRATLHFSASTMDPQSKRERVQVDVGPGTVQTVAAIDEQR